MNKYLNSNLLFSEYFTGRKKEEQFNVYEVPIVKKILTFLQIKFSIHILLTNNIYSFSFVLIIINR